MSGKIHAVLPMFGKRLAGDGSPHLLVLPMFGKFAPFLPNIGKTKKRAAGNPPRVLTSYFFLFTSYFAATAAITRPP
jgi:hypothetical protein